MNNTLIKEGQSGFEEYPDMSNNRLPDFNQLLTNRIINKSPVQQDLPGFDPHQLMVKKHKIETGEVPPDTTPAVQWPEADVKALEDFCKKYGILGFNCGRMPPIAAMAMLKSKLGLENSEVPLSERVPMGYQKLGTPINNISPNYPYQRPGDKRTVLNG